MGTLKEKHIENMRELIEEWRATLCTPKIDEISSEFQYPTGGVEAKPLFKYLREHLPYESLWLDHYTWRDKFTDYLDKCKSLVIHSRGDFSLSKYSVQIESQFALPILRHISQLSIGISPEPHQYMNRFAEILPRPIFGQMPYRESLRLYILYVDNLRVALTNNEEESELLYQNISDSYVHGQIGSELVKLFIQLKELESKIRSVLDILLFRKKYALTKCVICRG